MRSLGLGLVLLLLGSFTASAEPMARLTGVRSVPSHEAPIILYTDGSISDAPVAVVLDPANSAGPASIKRFTATDGETLVKAAVAGPGTYRFIAIAREADAYAAASLDVAVGAVGPLPPVDPPKPPGPVDPPVPPVDPPKPPDPPAPGPPSPPVGPDEYGAAQAMYDFATPLPDRAEGVKYAASLDAYAGRVEEYRKPGHDNLGRYWTEAFAALTALSGNGPAGWGLLDDRLGAVLRATAEEGRIADADGYYDAGVYAQIFTDAARGLRAAAGVNP